MTVYQVTPSDIKRGTEVKPNWYKVEVMKVIEKPSAKGDSKNTFVEMEIKNEGPFQGVPVTKLYNEKAPGTIQGFAVACGVDIDDSVKASGFAFDPEQQVGKQIEAFIQPSKKEDGSPFNDVKEFRRIKIV